MTRTIPTSIVQPTLADLMARFLASRSDAAAAAVELTEGEVEPHEIAAGFRVDARMAWTDAQHTINTPAVSSRLALPQDWAALVSQPASAFAVPLAAGNYPQRVRDLHPLLGEFNPNRLRPNGQPTPLAGLNALRTWIAREADKPQPQAVLLAAGVARALGELDQAEQLLSTVHSRCTGDLRACWENEHAALLWHSGRCEDALTAWLAMADSPVVSFNRGLACLFLGRYAEARTHLRRAVEQLPEESGWTALGRLYLAVAEIQS